MNTLKFLVLFIGASACFGYGMLTGVYKIFPYQELKAVQDYISGDAARAAAEAKARMEAEARAAYKFGNILKRTNLLVIDKSKEIIDCPEQSAKTGVVLAIGQSNIGNQGEYRYKADEVKGVINFFKGTCYTASSPLLGSTGKQGEWVSKMARNLIDNKTYDQVVVISMGIGGSTVAAWAEGGVLTAELLEEISRIQKHVKVTDVVWHQGESDMTEGVGTETYKQQFLSFQRALKQASVDAPIFISVASHCRGGEYPNSITNAQTELAQYPGITLGVNTDTLVTTEMRLDDCHFNKLGQEATATALSKIISRYHNTSH